MRTVYRCPKCDIRLVLHRPAIDSTRIKCRGCGTKFYAGKAAAMVAAGSAPAPEPEPVIHELAEPAEAAHPEPVAVEPKRERRRSRRDEPEHRRPRWLVSAGLATLALISAAGIFLTPTSVAPPELPVIEAPAPSPYASALDPTLPPVTALAPTSTADEKTRPVDLCGVWELQEPGGGSIELRPLGLVSVRAPLLTDQPLDYHSRWFIVMVDGNTYDLDFGPRPHKVGNHSARLVLQPDGTMRVTRYANTSGLSIKERVFKRKA